MGTSPAVGRVISGQRPIIDYSVHHRGSPTGLAGLCCPECKTLLVPPSDAPLADYTILYCCRPWPVVAGIPVFNGPPRLAVLIQAGRHREALLLALRPRLTSGIRPRRLARLLVRMRGQAWDRRASRLLDRSAGYASWLDLYFDRKSRLTRDYFYFKFVTPKHLVALSIASTLPAGRVLDVGCGAGQITRFLAARHETIGLDSAFWLLFLAKTCVAPEAAFVCCDAERPLPFEAAQFTSVISTNAFHFLIRQDDAWAELCRVSTGPIALVSLRHKDVKNHVANQARTIDGYRDLVRDTHPGYRIVSDQAVLERYLQQLGPDLSASENGLEGAALVSLVAGGANRCYDRFQEWPHAGTGVNPLYRAEQTGYRLVWPSAEFQADNPGFTYLKARVDADPDDNFVSVDLPDRYT